MHTTTMSINANDTSVASQQSLDTSIWSHILQEVQNSTKKTPPTKTIILLGDNESGRSTLVARLKGVENLSKGFGLEYHYIDVKDEDRDDNPKLSVWIPDGDGASNNLLKYALNESNIEHAMIIFVVSMSTPWSIMKSIHKWAQIIQNHIKSLNIDSKKFTELCELNRISYQNYQEPDDLKSSQTKTSGDLLKRSNSVQEDNLVQLDPTVLTHNLGVPCIVVASKSDSISILEKEAEYRIEHFDFIQFHLRKFCLNYGAALFYTSIKDKRMFDKLYRYILHKFYNYSFVYGSSIVDKEAIFIPSGWDNESKINILLENNHAFKSDANFTDIIVKPSHSKTLQRDHDLVTAIDDQEFLSKLQIQLNKTQTSTAAAPSSKQDEITSVPTVVPTTPIVTTTPPRASSRQTTDSTNLKSFFQNLLNKNAPNPNQAAPLNSVNPATITVNQTSPIASSTMINEPQNTNETYLKQTLTTTPTSSFQDGQDTTQDSVVS